MQAERLEPLFELTSGKALANLVLTQHSTQRRRPRSAGMAIKTARQGVAVERPRDLGLLDGTLEIATSEHRRKVQERPRHRRAGNSAHPSCLVLRKLADPMHVDARAGV